MKPSPTAGPGTAGAIASRPASDQASLVEGLRRGDALAYERLYRDHGARMLAVARRYLPVMQDAEDAVQDAMVSLVRAIGTFEGNASFTTWLHRVVVNASLMRVRTRSRRPETSLQAVVEGPDEGAPRSSARWSVTASQALEREDLRQLVLAGIRALPETYRVPLLLRDVEELDMATICTGLGVGLSTLKTRLSRARALLRRNLEPTFGAA
jgi:RNA polymerase sigma-70 factor (ECF subfamily)